MTQFMIYNIENISMKIMYYIIIHICIFIQTQEKGNKMVQMNNIFSVEYQFEFSQFLVIRVNAIHVYIMILNSKIKQRYTQFLST